MCQYLQYHSATKKMKRSQHKHCQLLFHQSPNSKTLYCRANHNLITPYNIRQQVHAEYSTAFFILHCRGLTEANSGTITMRNHRHRTAQERVCTAWVFSPARAGTTRVSPTDPLPAAGTRGAQPAREQPPAGERQTEPAKIVMAASTAQSSPCSAQQTLLSGWKGFPGGSTPIFKEGDNHLLALLRT